MHKWEDFLPESEEKAMVALWNCDGISEFYPLQIQPECAQWAPSTLLNLLYRLEKKGFIQIEKKGGRNVYRALVKRREYAAAKAASLLNRFYGNDLAALYTALLNTRRPGTEELEELFRLVDGMLSDRYNDDPDPYDLWDE